MKDIFTLLDEFMEANGYDPDYDDLALHFYELGKKDMKEQMLKDAVEATVMATKCGNKYQQLLISDWNSMSDMCNGDKVRIIIVKEEGE